MRGLGGPQTAQAPHCTKYNSPPINGQCTNHRIAVIMFCGFNVAMNGLTLIVALAKVKTKTVDEMSEMESYQL